MNWKEFFLALKYHDEPSWMAVYGRIWLLNESPAKAYDEYLICQEF